jgi:hypothetical protein
MTEVFLLYNTNEIDCFGCSQSFDQEIIREAFTDESAALQCVLTMHLRELRLKLQSRRPKYAAAIAMPDGMRVQAVPLDATDKVVTCDWSTRERPITVDVLLKSDDPMAHRIAAAWRADGASKPWNRLLVDRRVLEA